ncbi:MAG TPA: TraG family conjugative transposon ATPase [Puia sp.]|jgi:conjugation system TraG family ATPase
MKQYSLLRSLPFLEIESNCLLTKDGHLALGCELTKLPLSTASPEKLTARHEQLTTAINLLPNGCILHFQDIYMKSPKPDTWPVTTPGDWLAAGSDRHFEGRQQRVERSYCFLILRPDGAHTHTPFQTLLEPRLVPEVVVDEKKRTAFLAAADQFFKSLSAAGLQARPLTGEELSGTAESTGVLEQYMTQNPDHLHPFLEDVHIRNNGISVGRKEILFFTLADAAQLPPACAPHRRHEPYSTSATDYRTGYATPLGPQLTADHIYNCYLFLDNPAPSLRKLATRQRRLQSLAGKSRTNAVTAADIGAYLDHAAQPRNRAIKMHMNLMVWSDDPTDLARTQGEAITAITAIGATPHLETLCAAQLFWAGIPGNAAGIPSMLTFDGFTPTAACWLIPETGNPQLTTPSGLRLGDRHSGVPLHVDLSDEPLRRGWITNRNKFILGGSGSGKSFFTNLLVRSYYAMGSHIVLLDIGGSYKTLCQLLDGQYFTCDEKTPLSFNPFLLAPGETLDTEKKESLKALLLILWKKTDESFRRSEYVALSAMIEGYFTWLAGHPTTIPGFDGFYHWVRQDFQHRLATDKVRETDFDYRNFLFTLRPFCVDGEYGALLNATENTDLFNQRLIVFDLDAIKDHPIYFPVTTLIIMELFISKMRKLKGVRKVILLEEAWKAIAKEGMSEYIKYLFKTVRKFYGEAIVVTQDIEDIVSSPIVKNSIINNADCRILLDQSKFLNRFGQIQELLGLTEMDKTMVLSLNKANDPTTRYKEVFISLGPDHANIYRVEVSLEEYLTFTTEESEKLKVDTYRQKHGGIIKGLTALASEIRSGAVKLGIMALLTAAFLLAPHARASAQLLDIIDEAVKKALETADLKIQRLQTQTLWLQNEQKTLENAMTGSLLDDITGWVRQQDKLFGEYYSELWQIKPALTTYSKTAALIIRQAQLVKDCQKATAATKADPHLSLAEITQILGVYNAILDAGIRNTARLTAIITASTTQMDDAARLRQIDESAADIARNETALRTCNQQNTLLSLQRAKDAADLQTIKILYGIQ